MANSELSKRNQEFVFHLTKLLGESKSFDDDKTNSTISNVTEKLLAGQKTGQTARQLFGTPSEYYQDLVDPKGAAERRRKLAQMQQGKKAAPADRRARPKISEQLFDFSFWLEFIDTSWTLLIILAALYGLTMLTSNGRNQGVGVVTLFIWAIITGAAYVFVLRIVSPNPSKKERRPVWQRVLFTLVAGVVWVGAFSGLALIIPPVINPALNSAWLFTIAVVGAAVYYIWRRQSPLPKGILIIGSLATNAALKYREKYPKAKKVRTKK
ncbi:DUF1129 family protein [Oenococcus kitaharae]|uniref:Integral membrane protein n=1 Tax=Oenococcus kitaharae DSM 17330 TaxID=1045004 RepID=G9WJ49_9LACO|nr:DUF1129 family protein [Oenococcus kitaharae]EHN58498.1 hypothetical protein OKIT_0376 [Oenococcus kitaharae DSM 17330]MCV3296263.1 DUF1129 domain-containing protein [Oenococcus kitaharae]OEY81350.1 membrane protein [Oenococcus kitaharae]OEY82838.1 membrane protein [Oenococcus kitaharae]OEY84618.1 membrane protein [Oenococcus kitaharae]